MINTGIVFDGRMLFSSGIGTYIRNLLKGLFASGCLLEKILLSNDKKAIGWAEENLPGVAIQTMNSPIYSISEQFEMLKHQGNSKSIFWSPHYNIPLFTRQRLVVTVHDALHLAMPEIVGGLHKRFYAKWMFNAVLRKADLIFCDSQFTANEMTRLLRADPKTFHVVPLGVENHFFSISKGACPHSHPFFLYVGNVKPHKNLKRLVQAFNEMQGSIPHHLIIVGKRQGFITGDRSLEEELKKSASNIFFTEEISNEELDQYYTHAECLIQPSLYEGFGFTPLEAMACGIPVLSSNKASLPEVCGLEFHSDDGNCQGSTIYFNPLDIEQIKEKILLFTSLDSFQRARMVQNGLSQARRFSWEACIKQKIAIINQANFG